MLLRKPSVIFLCAPLALSLFLALVGCNKADFSGKTPHRAEAPPPPESKSFALSCAESETRERVELAYRTDLRATVSGEICLPAAAQATVLLVVDMSGSMGKHRQPTTNLLVDGNDPRLGESCGRLAAAKAVVDRLAASAQGALAGVTIGMIPFAGDVLDGRLATPRSLDEFRALLTADNFCSYVTQGTEFDVHPTNPGGIAPYAAGTDASTNYAAALNQATEWLKGEAASGRTVYFISDGEPTSGGHGSVDGSAATAGIEAGKRLRALGADVVLNGLLLGTDGAKARSIMADVAGAADRVRVAAKAEELAKEVVLFPTAPAEPESVVATLTGPDGIARPVELADMRLGTSTDASVATWVFKTSELLIAGEDAQGPLESSEHRLDVVARVRDPRSVTGEVAELKAQVVLEVVRF